MNCHPELSEGPAFCLRHAAVIALVVMALSQTLVAQTTTATSSKTAAPHPDNTQLYRNSALAFRYQIPYGWVDRTKSMQEGYDVGKGQVLLATFERPPEATGDTVNSAVVIASETAASYPGLKHAEDYLGPLTELATAQGFKSEGEPSTLQIDSRALFRADFVKPLGVDKTADQTNDKLIMRQCTLVLLAKAQIVSFTFIAGSEDEINDLIEKLHFAAAKSSTH